MANNTKEIQRRIKSIKNTRKITRAMEMVSAAKMKKEVERVLSIRAYASAAWNVLTNLSRAFEKYQHGLLEVREVKNILIVLVTSNKGLCGAYNSQVIKKIMQQVKDPGFLKVNKAKDRRIESSIPDSELNFDFISVGKKGFEFLHSRGYNVIASFDNLSYLPTPELINPLAKIAIDDYIAGKYDKVVIAYTDYVNPLTQLPKLRQLLPISATDLEKEVTKLGVDVDRIEEEAEEKEIHYKIEPEPELVIEHLLPRLVSMHLYHAILESNASKESSRMMAMRNASDAASDMVGQLEYSYNQIRQMNITQEIAEITSGRVALED